MDKQIISQGSNEPSTNWLALEHIARIELTSEESSYAIEDALLYNSATGWRAAQPGEQTIRLIFDTPQSLRHIWLLFMEREVERSQEFVLRWSADDGKTFHEIVRQQWNFSPYGSTQESEAYNVELSGVTQIELKIVPDRNDGNVYASLAQLRLA
jgi:hypothetical protein